MNLLSEPPSYENCIVWFVLVISRVCVCEYSEHSWRNKSWVVSWHRSSYLSTHPYRQTWLHKTLDVRVHGVAALGRSAASGQYLKHFCREVKRNCGPKREKFMGLQVFYYVFVATVFDVSL